MATKLDELPCSYGGFIGFPNLSIEEQIRIAGNMNRCTTDSYLQTVGKNMNQHLAGKLPEIADYYTKLLSELNELDHLFNNGCTPEQKRQIGPRIQELKKIQNTIGGFINSQIEA